MPFDNDKGVKFGKWHFYVWILFKNKKAERERKREIKKREEKQSFYIKFNEEFCEAIISATVKADRLFIESYQTLLCLTTTHTTCSRAKVCRSIQKRKKLIV